MLKNFSIELEVLNGESLFVDHIKEDAFLKDPKYVVPYKSAVYAIEHLNLDCEQIITNTLFKYALPLSRRMTSWQRERLLKMANDGCPAYEIAQAFNVSEEAVMKVVGNIIERVEREQEKQRCLRLAEFYRKRAEELDK
jgi:hypothetical protein